MTKVFFKKRGEKILKNSSTFDPKIEAFLSEKNKNTDQLLVKALRKGDFKAFETLFFKYNKKLYYFAKGHLGSREDAEGLVQEVFIKIWEKREDLNEYLSFNSYIFTITFKAILKHFRTKSREKKYMDQFFSDFIDESNETSVEVEYNNLLELANKAIEKLPEKRKLVYILSRKKGFTNQEIAEQLNISKRTVETHLQHALKFLREKLDKNSLFFLLFFYLFIR